MKYREQMIKDIFYMAGLLEGMTCMQGQTITEAMTASWPTAWTGLSSWARCCLQRMWTAMEKPKKSTKARERPINKRPGRCVCICTAKGRIIYMESLFEQNKNQRR